MQASQRRGQTRLFFFVLRTRLTAYKWRQQQNTQAAAEYTTQSIKHQLL